MLSPHELARFLVLVNAPETADVPSPDLEALVEHDLVRCVAKSGERVEIRVTPSGADLLARLSRTGRPGSAVVTKRA